MPLLDNFDGFGHLADHISDSGHAWTEVLTSSGVHRRIYLDEVGGIYPTSGFNTCIYLSSWTPAGADVDISWTPDRYPGSEGSSGPVICFLGESIDGGSFYYLQTSADGVFVQKSVGGGVVTVGSIATSASVISCSFRLADGVGTFTFTLAGVELGQVRDTDSPLGAGDVGVFSYGRPVPGTGVILSAITADDPPAPSLSPASATLNLGESLPLTPQNFTPSSFRSSVPAVANVDGSGLVMALSAGTATITAEDTAGRTATAVITVSAPGTGLTLAQLRAELDARHVTADYLDAAISSRLAAVGYMAPDNRGIASIKSRTDVLPSVWPAVDGSGRILLQPEQPGVTIPTVTNVTGAVNLGTITPSWYHSGNGGSEIVGAGAYLTSTNGVATPSAPPTVAAKFLTSAGLIDATGATIDPVHAVPGGTYAARITFPTAPAGAFPCAVWTAPEGNYTDLTPWPLVVAGAGESTLDAMAVAFCPDGSTITGRQVLSLNHMDRQGFMVSKLD